MISCRLEHRLIYLLQSILALSTHTTIVVAAVCMCKIIMQELRKLNQFTIRNNLKKLFNVFPKIKWGKNLRFHYYHVHSLTFFIQTHHYWKNKYKTSHSFVILKNLSTSNKNFEFTNISQLLINFVFNSIQNRKYSNI